MASDGSYADLDESDHSGTLMAMEIGENHRRRTAVNILGGFLLTGAVFAIGLEVGIAVGDNSGDDNGQTCPTPTPSAPPKPSLTAPGWLVERVYHASPVACPWSADPHNDADCRWRTERIESLRRDIALCRDPLRRNMHTFAHRGAPLVAPEETMSSWQIGIESGAGFIECDASVTKDGELICRHGTCDLQFTTDLLDNHPELVSKCRVPFQPANDSAVAQAECCTFDFTVQELQTLCARMESLVNFSAVDRRDYQLGPPGFRSGYLATNTCHQLVTFDDYLQFAKDHNTNVIPELKDTAVTAVENFLNRTLGKDYRWLADKFASKVLAAGFRGANGSTWLQLAERGGAAAMQTFDHRVAHRWKDVEASRGLVVEYLWGTFNNGTMDTCTKPLDCGTPDVLTSLSQKGVEIFAPPIPLLLSNTSTHRLVASDHSVLYKNLIKQRDGQTFPALSSWSLERSGCASAVATAEREPSTIGPCGFYYNTVANQGVFSEPDVLLAMDVLFRDVNIVGLFADFPASVSTYVNCVKR